MSVMSLRLSIPLLINSNSHNSSRTGLHNQTPLNSNMWCVLCRADKSNTTSYNGHRTKTACKTCNVPLCTRVYGAATKSCWVVFHERKNLQRRVLVSPPPTPTPSQLSSPRQQVLPQRRARSTSQDLTQSRRRTRR